MKKKLKFLADPSHGWVSVKYQDLIDFGIEGQISNYSYIKGDTVYLEEDLDAGIFLDAALKVGWEITFKESHTDRESPIRRLPSYRVREIEKC